jgi:hypothetical protein
MNSLSKVAVALICFGVTLFIALMLGVAILESFGWGVILWCAFMTQFVQLFIVSVPEVTGLLTVDYWSGDLHTYDTGVHFRYPWEQVKVGNYLNLRLTTEEVEETYPSSDGPIMEAKWSFQYKPDINYLATYITVDDSTIREGLREVGSAFLSEEIAKIPSEECKKEQHKLGEDLRKRFMGEETEGGKADLTMSALTLYGVKIVRASIADLDFERTVQAVRATQVVSKKLLAIAADIKDQRKDISDKDSLNAAMIMNKDISKSVTEVEGEGGEALAALLIAMSQGGKGGKK